MVQFGGTPPSVANINGGRNRIFRTIRTLKFNWQNAILVLVVFFVLRNLLKNDYRQEEMQYLRNSGMSEEQIERYIPKALAERKESGGLEQMKKDIEYLLKEVEELKAARESSKEDVLHAERGETLKSMDQIHQEKRRRNQEQLLKDHPDFKPSKRRIIKD